MRYNKNGTIALTLSEWLNCKEYPNDICYSPDIYTYLKFIKHLADGALFEEVKDADGTPFEEVEI